MNSIHTPAWDREFARLAHQNEVAMLTREQLIARLTFLAPALTDEALRGAVLFAMTAPQRASTSFFGPDGRLCDIDPRQINIEFRGAGGGLSPDMKGPHGSNGHAKGAGGAGDLKSPER